MKSAAADREAPISVNGNGHRTAVVERRRSARVRESFPMTLVPAAGLGGGDPLRAMARDYDAEGACVRAPRGLEPGTRLAVRLRLPRSASSLFRGLQCEFGARVRSTRGPDDSGMHELVLRWDKPLPEAVRRRIASYQRRIGLLVALTLATTVLLQWMDIGYFWYEPVFFSYSITLVAYLVSRFFICWRYKPPALGSHLPPLSVVISVRNEEAAIARTIETCYGAEYPADRRDVIVVDDGSTDRTPAVLQELLVRFPELKVVTQKPLGKRYAMAEGVRRARGEIVVFVDSDTFLYPGALKHIVCGFEDPSVGASAGYTEVENADKNLLTGLQEVRYLVSFRLLKSCEAVFSCVTCCPGCLSAYRKKYLLEILEPWLKQRFLGVPATFGDDRSLTNFILRKYRVIYNDQAMCSTMVPETWGHYMRQQVRWKKSWLREALVAGRFMYKKHPVAALSFYATAVFSLLSPAMVVRALVMGFQGHDSSFAYYFLGLLLVSLLQSLFFLYKRPSPNWVLGLVWMASSLILTSPQTYYAILTLRRNHWGTR